MISCLITLRDKIINILQEKIFESYPRILDVECPDTLIIEDLNDGKYWRLDDVLNFYIHIQYNPDEDPVWVHDQIYLGFITDLSSVDDIPFFKIKKLTIGNRWYVIHDWGFQFNGLDLSQKNWDTIMLLGLKKDGASSALSWRRWIGVQLGGRSIWKKYRKKQQESQ